MESEIDDCVDFAHAFLFTINNGQTVHLSAKSSGAMIACRDNKRLKINDNNGTKSFNYEHQLLDYLDKNHAGWKFEGRGE